MRIGLDLDGVIFNFVESMRQVFPSIPKDPDKVDLSEYLNPVQKQQFYMLLDNPHFFKNLPMIPGMERLIPYFNAQDTFVVTSRNRHVRYATRESLSSIGLKPIDVIFKHNKAKVVSSYALDVMIDDQSKYIEPMPKEQIALMPDLGYNREFISKAMEEGRMVFPYHGVEELYSMLKRLEQV